MNIEILRLIASLLLFLLICYQIYKANKYKAKYEEINKRLQDLYTTNNKRLEESKTNNSVKRNSEVEYANSVKRNSELEHYKEVNRILLNILLIKLVIKIKNKFRYSFKTNSGERFLSRITEIRNNKEVRVFVEGEPYYETVNKDYIKLEDVKKLIDLDIEKQHIHLISTLNMK